MQPANQQFETVVRESFARQQFLLSAGATLMRVASGEVDIELPFRADLVQQSGTLHAGVIAAIGDTACGYAALTLMPAGSEVWSVEFKINLLAPALGRRFIARGRVIRSGRTLTVCSADIATDERVIATMTGTFIRR